MISDNAHDPGVGLLIVPWYTSTSDTISKVSCPFFLDFLSKLSSLHTL